MIPGEQISKCDGLSALVLAADAVLLLVAVGPFIGEALLAASIASYTVGAIALSPGADAAL